MRLVEDSYYEFYGGPVKGHIRKEHGEQVDAFGFAKATDPDMVIFHPVNEGMIPVQYRQKLIESGLLKGISDLVLLEPRGNYHGALFEMKRLTKTAASPVSTDQKDVLRRARAKGYFTCVCYGADQFEKALQYYLEL